MRQKATGLLLVLSVAALVALPGCGSKVSRENYDRVQTDMTLEQVEDILGKGTVKSGGGVDIGGVGGSASVYEWRDDGRVITVTFVNNKVTAKTQENL